MNRRDFCLAIAAATSVVVAIGAVSVRRLQSTPVGTYRIGETVSPGLTSPDRVLPALILYVNSSCQPCVETMPFYADLARHVRTAEIIVAGFETEDALRSFAESFSIRPARVVSAPVGFLGFKSTPTLVLTTRASTVAAIFVGAFPDERSKAEVKRQLAILEDRQ